MTFHLHVFLWAAAVGALSFIAGVAASVLSSESNLAPLMSVIYTGPLGVVAGSLVGVAVSTRKFESRLIDVLPWLAGSWCGASIFPPIKSREPGSASRYVVFVMDRQLVGRDPKVFIRDGALLMEWILVGIIAVVACAMMQKRATGNQAPSAHDPNGGN
jgi:hypothetical protein